MDISSIGNVPAAISQAETGDGLAIAALRKSLSIQAQSAAQLIASIPQPAASGPSNLGQGVNTFA